MFAYLRKFSVRTSQKDWVRKSLIVKLPNLGNMVEIDSSYPPFQLRQPKWPMSPPSLLVVFSSLCVASTGVPMLSNGRRESEPFTMKGLCAWMAFKILFLTG